MEALSKIKQSFKRVIFWIENFIKQNLKVRKGLLKNLIILTLSASFITSWFKFTIINIFDNYLVIPILSQFLNHPIDGLTSDLFFALWLIVSIFYIRKTIILKYIINEYIIILVLTASALYLGERLYWKEYNHLKLFAEIKLLDPIYFSLSLILSISIINSLKWNFKNNQDSWLELDLPKNTIEEDSLNRTNEVDNFIHLLKSLPSNEKRSHVIGIVGSWGYGKTSFLSMLKKKLPKNTLVLEFNPWINSSTSNLIEDFYVLLDNKISQHIQTNNTIYKYGKALANLTKESDLFNEIKNLVFQEPPLSKRFEHVSKLVKKLNKEVYCIIDDLDRLDSDEVFEVLRIVRNTANFPNFTFVLAYDKQYLVHALNSKSIYNADKYLDKIVQVEIALPWISKFKLRSELINLIQSKIETAFIADPNVQDNIKNQVRNLILGNETEKDSKYTFERSLISELFLNMRDIVKFSNSFVYFLKNHYENIYVPDLFYLELIRFIDAPIISRLAANDYTIAENKNGLTYYRLYEEKDDSEIDLALFSPSATILNILEKHPNKHQLISLISKCFSLPKNLDFNSDFSMCYVDNFEFYFSFYLNENQVSFEFINNLIREDEI